MANALNFIISESKRYAALPYVESGNNHQKFSDIVNRYGLAGCQGQAWCATYQFALELMAFGKADALSHWCMTDKNYCGYSVFETKKKFEEKNRTGSEPRLGALVIFKRSHMGRVIAINSNGTFQCAEGNTSNAQFNRDGDSCAVKTYSFTDSGIDCFCYVNYGDQKLTRTKVIKAYRAVYEMAHNLGWKYGDSHSTPPCIGDATISCDRLIALAFWILGYQDQPAGGIVVAAGNRYMEAYLVRWGLTKNQNPNNCKRGDVVVFRNSSLLPNASWHSFGLTDFTNVNSVSKYDLGSNDRIKAQQPFHKVRLNEWEGNRWFYASFQIEEDSTRDYYEFNPSELKAGSTGNSAYEACVILKARGYKGVISKKTGKQQELELNFRHTIGDMAAASQYVADRMKHGARIDVKAGEVNRAMWQDLLGGTLPFKLYELPRCQMNGLSVLFWQEQMRAREILDDNGNMLGLDGKWDSHVASTVRKYCKAVGLKERDIVDWEVWQSVCGGI